jgi:uncharacterized membrane protein
MKQYLTLGLTVLAGAALFEAALIPGILIGGAAVLAPTYLPKLRRRLTPAFNSIVRPKVAPARPPAKRVAINAPPTAPAKLAIKQALAKTVTFRVIVTSLDFTTNYLVLGDLATAAGLSSFALVAGPVFYLVHETAWNYFGPSGNIVEPQARPLRPDKATAATGRGGLPVSRPLAKTITFRTIASAMDFTTNYVVIGDLATAAALSAFGFVVGPFVYLGHEMVWDHYGAPKERALAPPTPEWREESIT